jgi:hypothetical protein
MNYFYLALFAVFNSSRLIAQEVPRPIDYLQYTSNAIYLTQSIFQDKSGFKDDIFTLGISSIVMASTVKSLKELTKVQRPNGLDNKSFPSGHAAISFMGAELLRINNPKKTFLWIGGYGIASYVSVKRVVDKHHRPVDVISGAIMGFLSVRLSKKINFLIQKRNLTD